MRCESCDSFATIEVRYDDEPTNYLCNFHINEKANNGELLWRLGSLSVEPIVQELVNLIVQLMSVTGKSLTHILLSLKMTKKFKAKFALFTHF